MNTQTQQLGQPPPMIRLANGQMVPIGQQSKAPTNRRFLIVLQFHEGDKREFEELCSLIADLERVKNRDADILLFARFDATEPSRDIRSKLESKFERVLFERCRRKDAIGHPWGSNGMFYDMVTLFAQVQPWADQYYAFINLETDCVPTRPGWIHELIAAWKSADSTGNACIGFIHDDPTRHMNGVGVYAIDMWSRVGSNKLSGGSPQIPYDIRHAESILPLAVDSPLFHFEYRRPTIDPEELFEERKGGISPAIWHGVKDGSARAAVRARHVTFTEQRETTRQTVVTFYEPSDHTNQAESLAILEAWRDGWKSRGWNPVVLSARDAMGSPRFEAVMAKVSKLAHDGPDAAHNLRFMRWLALVRVGGGLMVDYDLIPANFTPNDIPDGVFSIITGNKLCGLRMNRKEASQWLDEIEKFEPAEPSDHTDDLTVFQNVVRFRNATTIEAGEYGQDEWRDHPLVHFSQSAVTKEKPGARKSVAVDEYLRAKT